MDTEQSALNAYEQLLRLTRLRLAKRPRLSIDVLPPQAVLLLTYPGPQVSRNGCLLHSLTMSASCSAAHRHGSGRTRCSQLQALCSSGVESRWDVTFGKRQTQSYQLPLNKGLSCRSPSKMRAKSTRERNAPKSGTADLVRPWIRPTSPTPPSSCMSVLLRAED